jgi:KDO2-lipid IV(A) lauroyltransferase
MMISGHCANWEAGGVGMLFILGKHVDLTYRAPNNPWADRMLMKARTLNGRLRAHSKSREGGQEIIRAMREGRYIGMLIDQKYNEGVAVPFFGRPAMTNPAFVQLARKFDYPLVPWQIERLKGTRFRITIHEPLIAADKRTEDVIAQAHSLLEDWIRKNPGQWLWLHRRWDSGKLKEMKEAA